MYYAYVQPNELYHFGVKGMKWGKRKANYMSDYSSKSTRKYWLSGNKKKAKISEELDKKISDYYKKQTVGKSIAKSILLGPGGEMTYNMARATGSSRGKAAVRAILDFNVTSLVGNVAASAAGTATNAITKGKHKGLASAASVGANVAAGRKYNSYGGEYSLQQRSIRRKYIDRHS